MLGAKFAGAAAVIVLLVWGLNHAKADFIAFSGDVTQEALWRAAAGGNVPLEDFEGYVGGDGNHLTSGQPILSLPALHVHFDGPPYPGAYSDTTFAHSGSEQWSNFGAGAGQYSDHYLRVDDGWQINALGFWNCDPQGSQPMRAYDFNGQLIGTIIGEQNGQFFHPELSKSFAGFVSTVPIKYIYIPGNLGDGLNHFDDLQIATGAAAPTPAVMPAGAVLLSLLGLSRIGRLLSRTKKVISDIQN